MKTINKYLVAPIALFTLLLGACIEEETIQAPQFPETVDELTAVPNDTLALEFIPNMDWQLSSDQMWCRFDQYEGANSISGIANGDKVILQLYITNDAWDFEKSIAELTLTMGDKSEVIARVTRLPKAFEIQVADVAGNLYSDKDQIKIGSDTTITLVAAANFDYNVTSSRSAEWLEIEKKNDSICFSVKEKYIGNAICHETDSIYFVNKVTRDTFMALHVYYTGKEYKLSVTDGTMKYVHGDVLSIGYNGYIDLDVTGNFNYTIETTADWLIMNNYKNQWNLAVIEDKLCDPIDNESDSIYFFNENRQTVVALHVAYWGMDPEQILIEGYTAWNWNVSADGHIFSKIEGLTDERTIVKDKLTFGVKASERKMKFLALDVKDSLLTIADYTHAVLRNDCDSVDITVDALTGNAIRKAAIFAFPEAIYDKAIANASTLEYIAFMDLYSEHYILIEFTQESKEETEETEEITSITIKRMGYIDVPVVVETDEEWLAVAQENNVPDGAVFKANMKRGINHVVCPLLTVEQWDPSVLENAASIYAVGDNGTYSPQELKFGVSGITEDELYFTVDITPMSDINTPYLIIFINGDKVPMKGLVVYPN